MNSTFGHYSFAPTRIFCIGRNYREHAAELNNEIPTAPVIFMKPATCLVGVGSDIPFPRHGQELHHEGEVVLVIGKGGGGISEEAARDAIAGVTLGLDLTLRDLQNALKKKGLPWEKAKAFDYSAPLGNVISLDETIDLDAIPFELSVNGERRQAGNTGDTIFSMTRLVAEVSAIWELIPGDLIYTGTPAGVGPLHIGDSITVESPMIGSFTWRVTNPVA